MRSIHDYASKCPFFPTDSKNSPSQSPRPNNQVSIAQAQAQVTMTSYPINPTHRCCCRFPVNPPKKNTPRYPQISIRVNRIFFIPKQSETPLNASTTLPNVSHLHPFHPLGNRTYITFTEQRYHQDTITPPPPYPRSPEPQGRYLVLDTHVPIVMIRATTP